MERSGNPFGADGVRGCLYSRMVSYFEEEDIFYAIFDSRNPLFSLQSYPDLLRETCFMKKAGEKRGFVQACDIVFGKGEDGGSAHALVEREVVVRMMEGDFLVDLTKGDYIMLGVDEVFPVTKEDFEDKYVETEEPYAVQPEYLPTVRSALTGESVSLLPYARVCIAKEEIGRASCRERV